MSVSKLKKIDNMSHFEAECPIFTTDIIFIIINLQIWG